MSSVCVCATRGRLIGLGGSGDAAHLLHTDYFNVQQVKPAITLQGEPLPGSVDPQVMYHWSMNFDKLDF